MLRYVKSICGTSFILAIAGCTTLDNSGIIQHRDRDYLKARSIAPLVIPPGLSSKAIDAHYPVPGGSYPVSEQSVSITPPELNHPFVPPVGRFGLSQTTANAAPAVAPQDTLGAPTARRDYYYDPFTRSSTGSGGRSIGSILNAIWPSKNKSQPTVAQNASPTAVVNTQNNIPTPNGQREQQPQQVAQNSSGFSLRSIWDSIMPGKKAVTETTATSAEQKNVQTAQNSASQPAEDKSKMAGMYYDRFTR